MTTELEYLFQLIDELEQLIENGKIAFTGQKMVNEEARFTQIQQIRAAIVRQRGLDHATKAAGQIIEETRGLSRQDQRQVIAGIANRLAQD